VLTWGAGGHGQLGHGSAAVPRDRDEAAPRLVNLLRGHHVAHAAAGLLHSGDTTWEEITEGGWCCLCCFDCMLGPPPPPNLPGPTLTHPRTQSHVCYDCSWNAACVILRAH